MTENTFETLEWSDRADGGREATIELKEDETAWNPASTKNPIIGPCVVEYTQFPDGGVDARTFDVDSY